VVPEKRRHLADILAIALRTPGAGWQIDYRIHATIRPITVDMSTVSGPTVCRWYDPSTGDYVNVSGSPFSNMGSRQFTPPGKNHDGDGDWVLVLEAS
jgi:hypothetical protein